MFLFTVTSSLTLLHLLLALSSPSLCPSTSYASHGQSSSSHRPQAVTFVDVRHMLLRVISMINIALQSDLPVMSPVYQPMLSPPHPTEPPDLHHWWEERCGGRHREGGVVQARQQRYGNGGEKNHPQWHIRTSQEYTRLAQMEGGVG